MKEEFINFTGNISQHKSRKVSKTVFKGLLVNSPIMYLIRSVIYATVIREERLLIRQKQNDAKKLESLWKRPERNLNKILNELAENISVCYAEPDACIVQQNEAFNGFMYFVYKGRFIVQCSEFGAEEQGEMENLRQLEKGDYFGEVSLLFGCNRSATVKTSDYGMYGQITDDVLEMEIFKIDPAIKNALIKRTNFYNDSLQIFLGASLKRISYLDKAPTQLVSNLCFAMTMVTLEEG